MKRKLGVPTDLTRSFDAALIEVRQEERAEGEQPQARYALSFSSELPVMRYDWLNDTMYHEVLSHDPAHVDMSRMRAPDNRLPMIDSHGMRTIENILGSVVNISVDANRRKLVGEMLFAKDVPKAALAESLVQQKHLETVSFGYNTMEIVEKRAPGPDGIPTFVFRWQPFEVSPLSVPADPTVGVGKREMDKSRCAELTYEDGEQEEAPTRGEEMDPKLIPGAPPSDTAAAAQVAAAGIAVGRDHDAEASQIREIVDNFKQFLPAGVDAAERSNQWIKEGLEPSTVRVVMMELMRSGRLLPVNSPPAEALDVDEKTRKAYSMQRAIMNGFAMRNPNLGKVEPGVELDLHQELERSAVNPSQGGFRIPLRFSRKTEREQYAYARALAAYRTLGTTQATGGQTLVDTEFQPDLIDVLRNKARCAEAGAQIRAGLTGILNFKKKTGVATVSWVQENGAAVTKTEPTFDKVTMTPKSLMGSIQYPRQLLVEAAIDFEGVLRNDLAIGHALAIDRGVLVGTGVANDPYGLYYAAGIPAYGFTGPPGFEDFVNMSTRLVKANVEMSGLSFLNEPALSGKLMASPIVPGDGSMGMILKGNHNLGELAGYPARSTNQMPDTLGANSDQKGCAFGYWPDILIGMWGNDLEIIVDQITAAGSAQIIITTFSMCDIGIMRNESFVLGTGITLQ